MAETKKAADAKAVPTALNRASESSDPAVHQLLAEIQTAQLNGDTDAASSLTAQLADLGYE